MALLHVDFFSETLGLSCNMDVILPQPTTRQIGMDGAKAAGPYKTLYLLHGLSDDHTIWQRRTSIERYVSTLPLAVVMPAVNRSFYCDQDRGLRYFTFVADELPALCQSWFPLSAAREDNFAAGLSMGGYGTWELALQQPQRFAALVPICGGLTVDWTDRRPSMVAHSVVSAPDPFAEAARRLKDVPVWIFHGGKDDVVPPAQSRRMDAALKQAGGDVRYTEFPDANHNSWDPAYATPGLWTWLFQQHR